MISDLRGYRGCQQRAGLEGRRGRYMPDNGAGLCLVALRMALARLGAADVDDFGIEYGREGYAIFRDGDDHDDHDDLVDLGEHTQDEVLRRVFARAAP
jgi:hypothetical protein